MLEAAADFWILVEHEPGQRSHPGRGFAVARLNVDWCRAGGDQSHDAGTRGSEPNGTKVSGGSVMGFIIFLSLRLLFLSPSLSLLILLHSSAESNRLLFVGFSSTASTWFHTVNIRMIEGWNHKYLIWNEWPTSNKKSSRSIGEADWQDFLRLRYICKTEKLQYLYSTWYCIQCLYIFVYIYIYIVCK